MGNFTFAYALVPYVLDILVGLLPLVAIYEAIKASSPFRWYAVLWYLGVIVGGFLVVDANIPALLGSWTVHTDSRRYWVRRGSCLVDPAAREARSRRQLVCLRQLLPPALSQEAESTEQVSKSPHYRWPDGGEDITVAPASQALSQARPG